MKTVNLSKESPSVSELLAMARKKSLLVLSQDGTRFVLEEADEFDREVAELGNSDRFMGFLRERSQQKGVTSIEEFAEQLDRRLRRTRSRRHATAKPSRK